MIRKFHKENITYANNQKSFILLLYFFSMPFNLFQVRGNKLSEAEEYLDTGSIQLHCSPWRPRIEISSKETKI